MKHFFLSVCKSSIVGHGTSSGQELRQAFSVSQSDLEVGTTAGVARARARVELGGWCGSRVPDRKIRNDEAFGSQTMNRLVATTKRAFPKATVELDASLSTQAVAGSRVSRVESESRSRVERL